MCSELDYKFTMIFVNHVSAIFVAALTTVRVSRIERLCSVQCTRDHDRAPSHHKSTALYYFICTRHHRHAGHEYMQLHYSA